MALQYTFKYPEKSREFNYLAPSLQKLFGLCCHVLNHMGYDVIVTSMVRKDQTIKGESGVHATGRALDFVPLKRGDVKEKEADYHTKMKLVAESINKMLQRADGKQLLIWHDVGHGIHFHLQVPWAKDFKDLDGTIPANDA